MRHQPMAAIPEQLLHDWLRHLDDGADDSAAITAFADASFLSSVPDPASAWALILEGIRRARTDKARMAIGASSLENFLSHTGDAYLASLEAEASADQRVRIALAHVWQDRMAASVWQRVQSFQKRYPPANSGAA